MINFNEIKTNKLSILLWVLQILLAAEFIFHGWIMLFPPAEYVDAINASIGYGFSKFIGIAELLAAAGLILPGVTRIMPIFTPLAALGLAIILISASYYHFIRGEISSAVQTLILFVITVFLGYMRWKVRPMPSKKLNS